MLGWTNYSTHPYETLTLSGADITQAVNTTGSAYLYRSLTTAIRLKLFKFVNTYSLSSGTDPLVYLDDSSWSNATSRFTRNGTSYRTAQTTPSESYICVRNLNTTADFSMTGISLKQVLTPSATGVTIVSTKGGTTFNWANKNSAFNYNDASGYTYLIYKVLGAPVVDSNTCTNADAAINLTAGSAAWSCTGIDDAAYQDGKHIIAVYDTAGVAAFGYYKSSGSGAVVNAKGGATQNWISVGAGFSTAGNYTRKVLYVGD
ncbi:MAG: hypothetical protein LLG05_12630 [Porphyromonadaceae bacterium]|nr:hypothetical protein [Porphyromonadaceae bacterium]